MNNADINAVTNITVTITRKFNNADITLGLDMAVTVGSELELRKKYEQAYDQLTEEHKALIERMARENPSSVPKPVQQASATGSQIVTIDVSEIYAESKGGKTYYKVRGGNFQKWGVRLWLDDSVIADVKELLDFDSIKQYPFHSNDATILLRADIAISGGKPQKVVRLYPIVKA